MTAPAIASVVVASRDIAEIRLIGQQCLDAALHHPKSMGSIAARCFAEVRLIRAIAYLPGIAWAMVIDHPEPRRFPMITMSYTVPVLRHQGYSRRCHIALTEIYGELPPYHNGAVWDCDYAVTKDASCDTQTNSKHANE